MSLPLLSIVVPVYNVEQYLEECLYSIQMQDIKEIEVLLVNDGSTDSSAEIARSWTRRDGRFALLEQENRGLGAARNVGADHARGRFLTFIDSDDKTPPSAYGLMVSTLQDTGSDFVTGNVWRFDSTREWQAPMYKGVCDTTRLRTHVSRDRVLLRDLLAHNKVWRHSFWSDNDLSFREGVLYEDLPTTIPAHLAAESVDVLSEVVDLWRYRDSGARSITQRKAEDVKQVRDRISAVAHVSRVIAEHGDADLKAEYDRNALERDVRYFVDVLPDASASYRVEALQLFRDYVSSVDPEIVSSLAPHLRVKYLAILDADLEGVVELVGLDRDGLLKHSPYRTRRGQAYLHLPGPVLRKRTAEQLRATDWVEPKARTCSVALSRQALALTGWAFIERIPAISARGHKVELRLTRADGAMLPFKMEAALGLAPNSDSANEWCDYSHAGYRAVLPLRHLERLREPSGLWTVEAAVTSSGVAARTRKLRPAAGKSVLPQRVTLSDSRELVLRWSATNELEVRVKRRGPELTAVSRDGGRIYLHFSACEADLPDELRVTPLDEDSFASEFATPVYEGRAWIDLTYFKGEDSGSRTSAPAEHRWKVELKSTRGGRYRRPEPNLEQQALDIGGGLDLKVRTNRFGNLVFHVSASTGYLSSVARDGEYLDLGIFVPSDLSPSAMVLRSPRRSEEIELPLERRSDGIYARFPMGGVTIFGDRLPLLSGPWDMYLKTVSGTERRVEMNNSTALTLAHEHIFAARRHRLLTVHWRYARLQIDSPLDDHERGPFAQRSLWQRPLKKRRHRRQRPIVVYESFNGRRFGDSPQAILAELQDRHMDARHLVVHNDHQVRPIDGAEMIQKNSEEYVRAMRTAAIVINNTHLPPQFFREHSQTVLQTWHGIGLKRLGFDLDSVQFANPRYLELLAREVAHWSLLISPNPFSTPILRRAFRFEGDVLESGSPRNDIFYRDDRESIRSDVRRRLGIAESKRVVLYAPTWRDDQHYGRGRYKLDLRMDFRLLKEALPSDVEFLFRSHANVVDTLPPETARHVIDASRYPDVQELLLLADVLVTDYSTLMFDFANTGRPMVFFAYDLAHYRDELRGFYFDFEAEAPGPIVTSMADLIETLAATLSDENGSLAAVEASYEEFQQQFCAWDDGGAAARVADALLERSRFG